MWTFPPNSPCESPDEQLAANFKLGCRLSFAKLVAEHAPSVFRICRRIVRDEDAANDCLNDTFLRAFSKRDTFDAGRDFGAWIRTIAYDEAIRWLEESNRERAIIEGFSNTLPEQFYFPQQDAEREEQKAHVRTWLSKLSHQQKVALRLRFYEDKQYGEIAMIMEIPITTVASHIRRGIAALRGMAEVP